MADNLNITQGTQTAVATDDVSSVHFQKIKLDVGADGVSVPFTNTVGTLQLGSVVVTNSPTVTLNSGTINVGTVAISNQPAVFAEQPTATNFQAQVGMLTGTVTTIAAGTQNTLGTVGALNNMVKGTVTRLETGTLAEVTLVPNVTTVANLTNGSVRMTVGTLTTGTLQNLVTGTLTQVTQVNTMGNLGTLNTGTITALAAGTITAGTINRLDRRAPTIPISYGTLGTAGGSSFGTISSASGAGTAHLVGGVSIVVMSGTVDAYIGFGTALNGANVLARGAFVPGGGIAREFNPPIESAANSEICYELAGAGTVYYTVQYWKGT